MKNHHKIKLIAASVALITSFGAMAGLGGLNVQSNLGEPFSGSITVTGNEAKALLNGGSVKVSNGNLRTSVSKSGDNAVVRIRSTKPIQDPILIFQMGVGSQSREYTAIIDPAGYTDKTDGATRTPANSRNTRVESAVATDSAAARERINRVVSNKETAAVRQADQSRKAAQEKKTAAAKATKAPVREPVGYGQRHLVRQGETVSAIARKIRPQGMTVEQTILALVNANPGVFVDNDADRMLAGKVLNIPPRAELAQLAGKAPAAERPGTGGASVLGDNKPAESVPADTTQVAPPSQTTASSPVIEAPASKEITQEIPTPAASAVVMPASEPAATPPVATKPTTEAVEPAEPAEDSNLWRWLLLGGAALISLFFLSKLLGKRKEQEQEPVVAAQADEADEDDMDVLVTDSAQDTQEFKQSAVVATAATVAAVATTTAQAKSTDDGLEVEDDFGDDIFFTDVEAAPTAKQDGIKLDLSSLDNDQVGIVSGAVTHDDETAKRQDIDWDTVESTESVYEPEPENAYASASFDVAESEKQAFATTQLTEEALEQADAQDDDAWDFLDDEAPANGQLDEAEGDAGVEQSEEVLADWTTSAAEADPEPQAIDEPLEFEVPEVNAASVAADIEAVVAEAEMAAEPEVFEIKPSEALAFQDVEWNEEVPAVAEADDTIEWESLSVDAAENSRSDSGFISESVGMTAPLEAKYELAKMYIEIGDPEAAKETLRELMEESDGGILAKAEVLLKEIDG